tara:strand:+ start:285 stop:431 length:147 start_codon:yes stop_codon:yes gene_type:complete
MINLDTNEAHKYIGTYSSKEKADIAGKNACEMYNDNMHYTVTLDIVDK